MHNSDWHQTQSDILEGLLESVPTLGSSGEVITGIRLGIGFSPNLTADKWTYLPFVGSLGKTPTLLPTQGINVAGTNPPDCTLHFDTSFHLQVYGKVKVEQAQKKLVSAAVDQLGQIISVSNDLLQTSDDCKPLVDSQRQAFLALACEAEMIATASADSQTEAVPLLSALSDHLADFIGWGAQVGAINDQVMSLAKMVRAQVGIPWLLLPAITQPTVFGHRHAETIVT